MNWKELLIEIASWPEPIRTKHVSERLDILSGEAPRRLQVLHQWGYLKYANRNKRGYGGYVVTNAGKKKVAKLKEEGG